MARKAREKSSSGIYAVMLRANKEVFKEKHYRDVFGENLNKQFGERIKGIRFFDESVHMLLKESENGIAADMKPVIISFARTYNRENECDGKLFKDRFRSVPVESTEAEEECIRYLNGGKKVSQFMMRGENRAAVPVKKKQTKPQDQKKNEEKQQLRDEIKEQKAEIVEQKPKKRDTMPTWLL